MVLSQCRLVNRGAWMHFISAMATRKHSLVRTALDCAVLVVVKSTYKISRAANIHAKHIDWAHSTTTCSRACSAPPTVALIVIPHIGSFSGTRDAYEHDYTHAEGEKRRIALCRQDEQRRLSGSRH